MSLPNRTLVVAWLAAIGLSSPLLAQDLYQDIQREFSDENRLQRDVARYQRDIATGHFLRAAVDRARIQNDEANIRIDQAQVQSDLNYSSAFRASQALIPHPQYPGYFYYASQPAQLYYYPNGQSPAPPPAGVSVPPQFVGPPTPPLVGPTSNILPAGNYGPPSNVAPPIRTIVVQVSNPANSGVAIHFEVDGVTYTVPGGYTQRITATAASIVEFDRGEQFGEGRYSLSDGPYEFRYTDHGWELYKKPAVNPLPANVSALNGLPRNFAPRIATPAPATEGPPTPNLDSPPPPPTPDPLPR